MNNIDLQMCRAVVLSFAGGISPFQEKCSVWSYAAPHSPPLFTSYGSRMPRFLLPHLLLLLIKISLLQNVVSLSFILLLKKETNDSFAVFLLDRLLYLLATEKQHKFNF